MDNYGSIEHDQIIISDTFIPEIKLRKGISDTREASWNPELQFAPLNQLIYQGQIMANL